MSVNYSYLQGERSMDTWQAMPGILHPPQRSYDQCCEYLFNVKMPEREHIEVEVWREREVVKIEKRKDRELRKKGWIAVKSSKSNIFPVSL